MLKLKSDIQVTPTQSEHRTPRKRTAKSFDLPLPINELNVNTSTSYQAKPDACLHSPRRIVEDDIKTMSVHELTCIYKHEFATHARIMADAKKGRCKVDPAFRDFGSFLKVVGGIPDRSWTLDRLDPKNPVYGPGLVRWATKREQANNRTNTVHLRGPDGTVRPLTDWARMMQVSPAAIRRRIDRGWTHEEAVSGKRESKTSLPPVAVLARPTASPKNHWPVSFQAKERWEPVYEVFRKRFRQWYPTADQRHASRAVFAYWIADGEGERAMRVLEKEFPDWRAGGEVPLCSRFRMIDNFARHHSRVQSEASEMMADVPKALWFARSLSTAGRQDFLTPVKLKLNGGGAAAISNRDDDDDH